MLSNVIKLGSLVPSITEALSLNEISDLFLLRFVDLICLNKDIFSLPKLSINLALKNWCLACSLLHCDKSNNSTFVGFRENNFS